MNGRLRSRLLTVGRAAGARSESGGIRFFGLALATLALASSLAATIAAFEVERVRGERMAEGALVPASETTALSETTLLLLEIDHLREERQFTVVFLSPGGADAPLPPGLDEWPRPGTAVVSPELLREGDEEGIAERYGSLAGTIDPSGLADATELLAYVRPARDLTPGDDSGATAVSGFGASASSDHSQNLHWLLADQDFTTPDSVAGLLFALGVVPSLLLAMVSSRVASHSRDRRDALITTLGGRTSHRLWLALGEAWIPVVSGALGAAACIGWFFAADRRLPIVDYVVAASDVRGLWWVFGLSTVAAAAFVLSAAVFQSAITRLQTRGNRPSPKIGKRSRALRAALFPCFAGFSALWPYLYPELGPYKIIIPFVSLFGAVLTMPSALAVGVALMGRGLAGWGRRRRAPASLTAGARMASRTDVIARQVFGVCACIFFLLFALTIHRMFSAGAAQAEEYIDDHGYSVVEVHPRARATAAEVDAFEAALPKGIGAVAFTQSAEAALRVIGPCPALESLDLPCPAEGREERISIPDLEGAFAAWVDESAFAGETAVTVASGAPSSALEDGRIALLAVTADGGDIGAGVLEDAGAFFQLGARTVAPGDARSTGGAPSLEQSAWVTLTGGVGLALLVFASGLGLTGEFLRFGRSIAPLSVLAGNRGIYWRTAGFVSLLPLAGAVSGGFLFGYAIMRPVMTSDVHLLTPAFVATCCAAALAAGTIMWIWSAAAAVASADRWRPGSGDD